MKKQRRWERWEHAKLVRLVADGMTNREIAKIIGRTQCGVHSRARTFRLRSNPPPAPAPVCAPTVVRIAWHQVPDWYALGWRFIGFSHARLCEMEWQSSRPERWVSAEAVAA